MVNKKKSNSGKKKTSLLTKIGLPALVVAVVGGSFFVNWNHLGRSPVAYYGLGAVPMVGMCAIDKHVEAVHHPKPKPPASNLDVVKEKQHNESYSPLD